MENQKKEEEPEVIASEEHGPEEHVMKHPLQNTWTLWYFEGDKSKDWERNQHEVLSFDTIEDFWSLYNHIKTASELKPGCDYSLFKKGIRPMWEDAANMRGGRWFFNIDKKPKNSDVDTYWLEIILCMIGEAFDGYSDYICGAVINNRQKKDRIAIWISDCQDGESVKSIGHQLRDRIRIPKNIRLGYQKHTDFAKSGNATIFQFEA